VAKLLDEKACKLNPNLFLTCSGTCKLHIINSKMSTERSHFPQRMPIWRSVWECIKSKQRILNFFALSVQLFEILICILFNFCRNLIFDYSHIILKWESEIFITTPSLVDYIPKLITIIITFSLFTGSLSN